MQVVTTPRPKRSRIYGIPLPILYLIALLMLVGTLWFISNKDPLVLYYGVHMHQSQLRQYVSQNPQQQGVYCIQIAPFTFMINPLFACFDTQAELNDYANRRAAIQKDLAGNP
ncbi:MAG: hypothetical protein LCI00_11340 [Chloroflexi bacterium]|nr:hypothetical protein [Chloroflexota bacterium]MCC6896174.1 hypothetical protein [Anaerolineae bacterium]